VERNQNYDTRTGKRPSKTRQSDVRSFDDDSQRVAYLFELYQKLSGEIFLMRRSRVGAWQ
jgi:hypothetical protein